MGCTSSSNKINDDKINPTIIHINETKRRQLCKMNPRPKYDPRIPPRIQIPKPYYNSF